MTTRVLDAGIRDRQHFAFDGSLAVSLYDLLYHDTNDVKPTTSQADQLTQALNQAMFAPKFAGLAGDTRTAAETNALTDFPVLTDVTVEMACASATWEVGDLVAPVEYTAGAYSGTALELQKLTKTTDPALAIGYCVKREGSAVTKVQARLISRVVPHQTDKADYVWSFDIYPGAGTTRNLLKVPEKVTILSIDVETDVAQAITGTLVKAATGAAPASGTTPLHAANGINFNTTANTTQSITLTSTAADLTLVPTDKIGLVFNSALSTGQASITVRAKRSA